MMMALSFRILCLLLLLVPHAHTFLTNANIQCKRAVSPLNMVRNIDLPEALVFYGKDVYENDDGELLPGVSSLIQECKEIQTPVVVILEDENDVLQNTNQDITVVPPPSEDCNNKRHQPPNPRALYEAVNSLLIQPRGFGGSSGFGRKLADPERSPEFQYTVVFCNSLNKCRAARYVGARVVCCNSNDDNDLADAIVDEWDELSIDDIATPGSYWLNPPHPKDDEGNRVDIYEIIDYYEQKRDSDAIDKHVAVETRLGPPPPSPPPTMDDDEMARILADLDSI